MDPTLKSSGKTWVFRWTEVFSVIQRWMHWRWTSSQHQRRGFCFSYGGTVRPYSTDFGKVGKIIDSSWCQLGEGYVILPRRVISEEQKNIVWVKWCFFKKTATSVFWKHPEVQSIDPRKIATTQPLLQQPTKTRQHLGSKPPQKYPRNYHIYNHDLFTTGTGQCQLQ